MRSTAHPLLILVAISLTPTEVGAESITYFVADYPVVQNGYTVSGTITTNGAIGNLVPSDVTSWDITITSGTTLVTNINTTNSVITSFPTFIATQTDIAVGPLQSIAFIGPPGTIPPLTSYSWSFPTHNTQAIYFAEVNGTQLWDASVPFTTVASIPEPSSAVLAVIGAGSVVACGLVRRRRARRRQSDAGHTQPTE